MTNHLRQTLFIGLLLLFAQSIHAQQNSVAIGTSTPNPKAVLTLVGNNQGLLIPSVADPTSIGAAPGDAGMIVYNSTDKKVYVFDGGAWRTVGSVGGGTTYTLGFDNTTNSFTLKDNTTNIIQPVPIQLARIPVSSVAPTSDNQVLIYDKSGTNTWTPATISGDVTPLSGNGNLGKFKVSGLNGNALPSTSPTANQTLIWNGTSWTYGTPSALPLLSANQLCSNNGSNTGINVAGALTLAVAGTTGVFAIANNAIADANVTSGAAIAGTKINPNFGGQTISTTGLASIAGGISVGNANQFNINGTGNITKINGIPTLFPGTQGAPNTVLKNNGSGVLSWGPIGSTEITDGSIVDADISTTAAIAGSKINPDFVAQNISTTGTAAIGGGLVAGSANQFSVNNSGNITKINSINTSFPGVQGNPNSVLTNNGSGVLSWTPAGLSNPFTTTGDILFATGTTPTRLAGASGFLKSTGAAAPTWSVVSLASDVSGTLPIANGGTGAATAAGALTNLGGLSSSLTSGNIFVGSAGNVAVAQALSGDATIDNAGILTLANSSVSSSKILDGTIADADVSTTAAISGGKINPNFGSQVISTTGTVSAGTVTASAMSVAGSTGAGSAVVNLQQSGTGSVMDLFSNTTSNATRVFSVGSNVGFFDIRGDGEIHMINFLNTARVGINTATPDTNLSVSGSADKSGGGAWAAFSDKRVKKNITEFTDGLSLINKINPIRFKYNGLGGNRDDGKDYVGVIAQDMQSIAPYMIYSVRKKLKETDTEDTDLLMYDGSALTYILVNAVKEQQQTIDKLKAQEMESSKRIAELETSKVDLETLKAEIAEIKKVLDIKSKTAKEKKGKSKSI